MGFFRRNKKPEYEIQHHDVPLSTMVRWFVHDIGYGEDRIDSLIGLSPISAEGVTKELEDSDNRLLVLRSITPFIETMAEIASNTLSTIAVKAADEQGQALTTDDDSIELLNTLYYSIAMSSIIGAFSIASALGIIEITAIASENKDIEGLFYE
jgi:hypothetical protein